MKINKKNQLPLCISPIGEGKCFFLTIILMVIFIQVHAQSTCTQNLRKAEKKFEGGQLTEVPEIVSYCLLNKEFSSEEMLKAYKLLTITYLYLDDSLNAEISFYNLLKEFPDFVLNESVEPAELVNLFHTYRTLPLYSFGLQAGTNFTLISPVSLYGIDNTGQRTENYQPLLGYHAGFRFEVPISKRIFITTGSSFNMLRYRNIRSLSTTSWKNENENDPSYNFAQVNFSENQSWINIPLTIGASLGNNQIKNYFYAGASTGYLIASKANISRSFSYASNSGSDIKGPDINVKELRYNLNFWGVLGAGLKIRSGLNQINIEAQYDIGFLNLVNASKRYSNSQLINRYGYLDNDIKLSFLTLKGSYMITRYKPKKIVK